MSRPPLGSARALGWGLFFFVALQVGFTLVVDWYRPDFYDAEFGVRLRKWRALRRLQPDRPALVLLGSSRCVMNFAPENLPPLRSAGGADVLLFNFSHLASGPVMNLVEYHRMRRFGVRPDYLVVEVMPPCLSSEGPSMVTTCMTAPDLPTLHPYVEPVRLYGRFLMRRLVPWYRCRALVLDRVVPSWVLGGEPLERRMITLGPLGGDVGWQTPESQTPQIAWRRFQQTQDDYVPRLREFRIRPEATRAYDELLSECRRDGIPVVLLLTPEGDLFRSWYPPRALAEIEAWCADMRRRHGVPIIDARRWLAEEDFIDSHHVCRAGATAFTRRLGREVLRPFVEGTLPAGGPVAVTSAGTPAADGSALQAPCQ
jgi:hypothetical protein